MTPVRRIAGFKPTPRDGLFCRTCAPLGYNPAVVATFLGCPWFLAAASAHTLPTSMSPDGSRVALTAAAVGTRGDLPNVLMLGLDPSFDPSGGTPSTPRLELLLRSRAAERNGEISPDGRWLAYESDETVRFEIYARPFPQVDAGQWQVSFGGGLSPLWSPDARELFYVGGNAGQGSPTTAGEGALMRVAVVGTTTWRADPPVELFRGRYAWSVPTYNGRQYDITPDGRRFVLVQAQDPAAPAPQGRVIYVQNWARELAERLPVR